MRITKEKVNEFLNKYIVFIVIGAALVVFETASRLFGNLGMDLVSSVVFAIKTILQVGAAVYLLYSVGKLLHRKVTDPVAYLRAIGSPLVLAFAVEVLWRYGKHLYGK
jgi:ABC-type nickel/cobalt efflux system permease component RcnA